ncbi:MAG: hypothetical protein ABR585_10630 [Gemmatimonadaceae bacterium]
MMSPFEFVAAFFSIVLGLGLAHVLGGISSLLEARARVRTDWVHSVWIITILLILIHSWWGMWALQAAPAWPYAAFLSLVAYLVALYIVATLLLPRVPEQGPIDLGGHFHSIRPLFLSFVSAAFAMGAVLNYTLFATGLVSIFVLAPGIAFVLTLVGALTRNRLYNAVLAVFILLSFVALMVSDTTTLTS